MDAARRFNVRFVMFSVQRFVKIGYVLALGSAVLVLSRPAPVRAQRTLAYPFLPGAGATAAAMAALNATAATPMVSYTQAQSMLTQAGAPVDPFGVGMSGGAVNGVLYTNPIRLSHPFAV
jgi:hypothetical protein